MANTTGLKFGGREKGTPNKDVSEIRDAFQKLIEGNIDQLEKDLSEMSGKDRINAIINLASYVIPKLKASEIVLGESRTINIQPIEWVD